MNAKNYYMNLQYSVVINEFYDDGDHIFSAEIKEMPGLIVYGDSLEEVYEEIELAKEDWIDANIEWGREIAEPIPDSLEDYSGRLTLRLPRTLHRTLKNQSLIEGVSLNQTVIQLINSGLYNTKNDFQVEELRTSLKNIESKISGVQFYNEMLNHAFTAGKAASEGQFTLTSHQPKTTHKNYESKKKDFRTEPQDAFSMAYNI